MPALDSIDATAGKETRGPTDGRRGRSRRFAAVLAVAAVVLLAAGCTSQQNAAASRAASFCASATAGLAGSPCAAASSGAAAASSAAAGTPAPPTSGTSLVISGSFSGTASSGNTVCNSDVAVSQHKWFWDFGGTSASGKAVIFSGSVNNYSGPATYSLSGAANAGIVLSYGGSPMAGYGSGSTTGSITIASGGSSASVSVSIVGGGATGTAQVTGTLVCTTQTTA